MVEVGATPKNSVAQPDQRIRIGVLALQGDFREHIAALRSVGSDGVEVRLPRDFDRLDGIIIPGGESTTISKLMREFDLVGSVKSLAHQGKAIWGTCAGMVVVAREATDLPDWAALQLIDIAIRRNAYGRQIDSFEQNLTVTAIGGDAPFHGVFIRAPAITQMGPQVEVLARLADGSPVAVRQDNVVATAFHPELTGDLRFHSFIVEMARASRLLANQTIDTPGSR